MFRKKIRGISTFGGQVEARAQQRRLRRLGQEEWEETPVRERATFQNVLFCSLIRAKEMLDNYDARLPYMETETQEVKNPLGPCPVSEEPGCGWWPGPQTGAGTGMVTLSVTWATARWASGMLRPEGLPDPASLLWGTLHSRSNASPDLWLVGSGHPRPTVPPPRYREEDPKI